MFRALTILAAIAALAVSAAPASAASSSKAPPKPPGLITRSGGEVVPENRVWHEAARNGVTARHGKARVPASFSIDVATSEAAKRVKDGLSNTLGIIAILIG